MEPRRVGVLVRISADPNDERAGVVRQERDCRELADRRGWDVAEVYPENDTSAYKKRKVTLLDGRRALRVIRPEFRRMLDDLESGRIEGVVAYDLDRMVREPRDLEDLIDVVEVTGRPAESVTGSLQLSSDAGVTMARVLVAMANKASRDTARRVSRAAQERAETGRWHGSSVAFGYSRVMGLVDGRERITGWVPHAEHASWVREAVRRLLAGEALYGICTDWNGQGRRTGYQRRNGGGESTWYPRTLKNVVTSPSIAGYRERDGQLYEAQWDAIVDRDDWHRLRELLAAPERKQRGSNNGNARKYALSGLVQCAECGHVMVSMTAKRLRGPSFVCSAIATGGCGSMRIAMEPLERYVFAHFFRLANTSAVRRAVAGNDDDTEDGEESTLRSQVAADERALERLADERDDGELTITTSEYRRRHRRLTDRMAANQQALTALVNRRARTGLPTPEALRDQWDTRDNAWRRAVLSVVIDHVEVSRFPKGVASNLTPRRNEDPDEYASRLDAHRAEVTATRVRIVDRY